jgi:hypothetical protein
VRRRGMDGGMGGWMDKRQTQRYRFMQACLAQRGERA